MSEDDDRVAEVVREAGRAMHPTKREHFLLESRVAQLERRLFFAERRIEILTRALLGDDDDEAPLQ